MGMPQQQGQSPGMAFSAQQPQGAPPFFPGSPGGSPPFLPQALPSPAQSFQQSAGPGAPPFNPPNDPPVPQNRIDFNRGGGGGAPPFNPGSPAPGTARAQGPGLQTPPGFQPPGSRPNSSPMFVPDLSMSPGMNLQTLQDTGRQALGHPAWQNFLFGGGQGR